MMALVVAPPDYPERQIAAIEQIERMAEQRRATFEHRQWLKHHTAAKRGIQTRNSHGGPAAPQKGGSDLAFADAPGGKAGPISSAIQTAPGQSVPAGFNLERKL